MNVGGNAVLAILGQISKLDALKVPGIGESQQLTSLTYGSEVCVCVCLFHTEV